tara:strand:+ start:533 stop:937 length:405 start_codon:yes stop_codon:yes gene_type:complete
MKITVETVIQAPKDKVWSAWLTPEDITKWNHASDDWCCPSASVELKTGGKYYARMEAVDGSTGFDFECTFRKIVKPEQLQYEMGDGREVTVEFIEVDDATKVVEIFDAENVYSIEQQRKGWQSILDNFKKHVEN